MNDRDPSSNANRPCPRHALRLLAALVLGACTQTRSTETPVPADDRARATGSTEAPPPDEWPELFEASDGRFGFRNAQGEVVLPPRYLMAYPFSDGVAFVVDEEGWACIDRGGRVLLRPFIFDNGPDYLHEDLFRYVEGDKVGFADRTCTVVIGASWDFAGWFDEGRAPVCRGCAIRSDHEHASPSGGVWGFIDTEGREVVPLEWDSIFPFRDGEGTVYRGNIPRRVDHNGRILPVITEVRFVALDDAARGHASALAERRESLAACADDFAGRRGGAGFVRMVLRHGEMDISGFGDETLHTCLREVLEGLGPTGKRDAAHLTFRLGTPPGEASLDPPPPHAEPLVLHDDGTCGWIERFPCKPKKRCQAPEEHTVVCPDRLAASP